MIESTKRKKSQVLKKLLIILSNHTQVKTKMKYRFVRLNCETLYNYNIQYSWMCAKGHKQCHVRRSNDHYLFSPLNIES